MWMVGCEKKEDAPANPSASAAKSDAKQAGQDMQNAAKDTAAAAKEGTQATADAVKSDTAKAPTTAPSVPPAANTAASATEADAQAKYQQVLDYIKDNKLDLADKSLTELEKNKATLPTQVAGQLPTARSALDAAKAKNAAGAVKLPGQ
jgi:hypothetical protein